MGLDLTFEDRHGTAPQPFSLWALAQFDLSTVSAAADLGCGDGRFTLPLARELLSQTSNEPVEVLGIDRNEAAIAALDVAAASAGLPIRTRCADARQRSVVAENSMDLVMCNFLLHLLPPRDVQLCLDNVMTWLRPEGLFVIAGYGENHMSACFHWLREALKVVGQSPGAAHQLAERRRRSGPRSFVLQDGIKILAPTFRMITYLAYEDTLIVSVDDLAELTLPSLLMSRALTRDIGVSPQQLGDALVGVMNAASEGGTISVNTDLGMLVACGPRSKAPL